MAIVPVPDRELTLAFAPIAIVYPDVASAEFPIAIEDSPLAVV